ncbi:MAG: phosphate ABC transporter permease subunit PstC [Actinobacteria bacterium]|nr:phosphate ABC transporter permease subunit PstC [Actinomycetota bacterium]NBP54175.1 phosphate ABC transporter permease subunit PstC [Actinomycetota bacterium]
MAIAIDSGTASSIERRKISEKRSLGDRVFRRGVTAGALTSFVVMCFIAALLFFRGFEIFRAFGLDFVTTSTWDAADGTIENAKFGVAAMLVGSIVTAVIAMVVAFPFVVASALFLEFYASKKLKFILVSILDLMAAIPSIIYGLWGYLVLMPLAAGWAATINKYLGWIPIFGVEVENFDASPFVSGLVLALMILPIAMSVTREVYSRAPLDQIQAAYALGGSRWGAIRAVVLPFGRSGLVGGMLLGLGRALGETIAVLLTLNLVFEVKFQILASAGGSVASLIASRIGEATPLELKALMAAGLVLFVLTLLVNFGASSIVARAERRVQ